MENIKRKMKKIKPNPWKRATIVLGIIVLLLLAVDFIQEKRNTINLEGFEISKANLAAFLDLVHDGEWIEICSLETRECIKVRK